MRPLSPVLDATVVLVFAAAGRSTHVGGLTVPGVLGTAWPFVAGMLLGHLVLHARHVTSESLRSGVLVWVTTLAGGMALRALTGAGTAPAFVLVAAGVLGLGLLGTRLVLPAPNARAHRPTR